MNSSEKLKQLIAGMTLKNSYWGYLFSRVRRIPDENLPSIMGVCYESGGILGLRFSPKLVENTSNESLKYVLEHEGMHILNMHIPRLMRIVGNEIDNKNVAYKINQWNIASDCCVNSQIKDFPKELIISGDVWKTLFPDKFDLAPNKSSEIYFWELMERNSGEKEQSNDGNSNKNQQGQQGFDSHDGWLSDGKDIINPHTAARKLETYTQDIVRQTTRNFNKNRGRLPSNIQELINELLQPPKAPYFQIIRKLVVGSRLSKFKPCSTKINRKRTYAFNLKNYNLPEISPFPGKVRDRTFYIGILIDTSGSQSKDDLMEALSGIKNIIENDRSCKVTVIEIDTIIQKEYKIKKLSDIDFKIKGRGGTILKDGLFRFKELNVDIMLAFSDGYCDDLNILPRKYIPKKNIWVIPEKDGSVENINRTGPIIRI